MKVYIKPILLAFFAIAVLGVLSFFALQLYDRYINKPKEEVFVETQVDFATIYPNNSADQILLIYNQQRIEEASHGKEVNGNLYLPMEVVIEYIDDRFFYDEEEKVLTYTTMDDILRMKADEASYSINGTPVQVEIGFTVFDDKAYIPLSLVQKFSHHEFIFDETYFVLQIQDWYQEQKSGEVFTKEDAYIRVMAEDKSPYIHQAFQGMEVVITGEEGDYYQVITKEGFFGYIRKEYVRSVTTKYSNTEPVESQKEFPSLQFEGKINLAWHQVFNTTANQSVAEKFANAVDLDVISPTWFELTGTEGDVRSIADLDYVRWAHSQGYQVWALFGNLGEGYTRDMTHEVLASSEKRRKSIEQIMTLAEIYELDGINFDFEAIPEKSGEYYIQYIKELSVYCRQAGLIISADLPVPKPWTEHMGRKEIGEYLDYFVIMGYDEHWGSSPTAGSVASIGFVREGVIETLKEVPKEKVILGIPYYTRLWTEETVDGQVKVSSKAYGMDSALALMNEKNVTMTWDDTVMQYYGEYTEEGKRYRMWLEDVSSLEEKVKLVEEFGLGGIAGWKIGLESDSIWAMLSTYLKP